MLIFPYLLLTSFTAQNKFKQYIPTAYKVGLVFCKTKINASILAIYHIYFSVNLGV